MMVRMHVRVEPRAAALLDAMDSKSAYLSEVVAQRWRAAQQALAWLRDEGWSLAQLRQAMGLLGTSWEQGIGGCDAAQPMRQLAAGMSMAGVDACDERVCRALCVLAGEWWAGNDALKQQMEEPPVAKKRRAPAATTVQA